MASGSESPAEGESLSPAGPAPSMVSGRSRRTTPRKQPKQAEANEADKQAEADEAELCFLCEQPIDSGFGKNMQNHLFHIGECINAARSARRTNPAEIDSMMESDPGMYRQEVAPLVWSRREGSGSARSEAFALKKRLAKRKVKQTNIKQKRRIRPKLKLNKTRAMSFWKQWDNMNSSQASSEFEHRVAAQGGKGDRVLVTDNEREESASGEDQFDIEEQSCSPQPDRHDRRDRHTGGDRHRRRDRHTGGDRHRRRDSGEPADRDCRGGGGRRHDQGRRSRTPRHRGGVVGAQHPDAGASSRRSVRLTEARVAQHEASPGMLAGAAGARTLSLPSTKVASKAAHKAGASPPPKPQSDKKHLPTS